MHLSSDLLYEEISKVFPAQRFGPEDFKVHLRLPLLCHGNTVFAEDNTYVGLASDFEEVRSISSSCCIILLGEAPEWIKASQVPTICINEDISLSELFNIVQDVFKKYSLFLNSVSNLILNNADIQQLIDEYKAICPSHSLLIIDSNFNIIRHNLPAVDSVESGSTLVSLSFFSELKNDPEYVNMRFSHKTFTRRGFLHDQEMLMHNIFISEELCGTLILVSNNTPITNGNRTVFERFAEVMELFLPQHLCGIHSSSRQLQTAIVKILDGEKFPVRIFDSLILKNGWDVNDHFEICYIPVSDENQKIGSAFYLCMQLSAVLPHSSALIYKGSIVIIFNITRSSGHSYDSVKFKNYLKTSGLIAGISNPFGSLCMMKDYYHQAESAVEIGSFYNPDDSIHLFRDHALLYLLSNMQKGISVSSLCPSGLLAIRDSDEKQGTDYLKTLNTYFRLGCNSSKTAKALYISRSTLIDRITRIRTHFGLSWNEYNDRLYIMICLKLIDLGL